VILIEYEPDGSLEMTLDEEGRLALVEVLRRLTPDDHEHLMTEAWGGHGLSQGSTGPNLIQINQLTITLTSS